MQGFHYQQSEYFCPDYSKHYTGNVRGSGVGFSLFGRGDYLMPGILVGIFRGCGGAFARHYAVMMRSSTLIPRKRSHFFTPIVNLLCLHPFWETITFNVIDKLRYREVLILNLFGKYGRQLLWRGGSGFFGRKGRTVPPKCQKSLA